MDDTPTPPIAHADWLEALAESDADLAAGRIVSGEAVLRDLTNLPLVTTATDGEVLRFIEKIKATTKDLAGSH